MGAPTGMQTRSRQRGVPAASSRGVFGRSAESRGRCRVAPRRRARSRDAALGFGITEPPCSGRVSVRDGDLLGPLERRRLGGSLSLGEDADNVAWPGAPVCVLPRRRRGWAACPLLTESPAPATPGLVTPGPSPCARPLGSPARSPVSSDRPESEFLLQRQSRLGSLGAGRLRHEVAQCFGAHVRIPSRRACLSLSETSPPVSLSPPKSAGQPGPTPGTQRWCDNVRTFKDSMKLIFGSIAASYSPCDANEGNAGFGDSGWEP